MLLSPPLLNQHLVVLEWNLSTTVRNVQTSVAGMNLTRGQTSLVERPSHVQRLARIRMSANNRAWRNRAMSAGHPTSVGYTEHLKLVLHHLLPVPAHVHRVFARQELSGNLFALVISSCHIDLRSVGVMASYNRLRGHSLTRRPAHPTNGRYKRGTAAGYQNFILQTALLRSSVGEIETPMGGVNLSRSQTALVVRPANEKWLSADCRSGLNGIWRDVSIAAGDPRKSCSSQNLKKSIFGLKMGEFLRCQIQPQLCL